MGMPVALGNGVKVDKGSASRKSDSHRIRSLIINVPVSMKKTADWRAVCGKTVRTVRREGRAKPVPTPIDFRLSTPLSSRPEGEILCIRNIFEAEDFSLRSK
uniref:Uncharacterized protein n=2 Tax=Candidatus Kentrum sp. LPFa TaxID=2126335 RepID=A0A450X364_9GAMM|nr:MAG: hypothetical protein BECKLPF1236A_GA0070988_103873 [Candidatus Kentron sp. LPFa]